MNRKISLISMLFLIVGCSQNIATPNAEVKNVENYKLVQVAKTLPHSGVLMQAVRDHGSFVYLKVSNEFSLQLYPILVSKLSKDELKCLRADNETIGEHVSLFYPGDITSKELSAIPFGKTFDFKVESLMQVVVNRSYENKSEKTVWYVLMISSPELAMLHNQYSHRHEPLHISIAVAKFNTNGDCYYDMHR